MASRKWLSVLALTSILAVGWFVGTQSITTAEETAPADGDVQNPFEAPLQKQPVPNSDQTLVNDISEGPTLPGSMPTLQAPARPTAWEYKSRNYDDASANKLGKEGWELVNVYARPKGSEKAVYKRPFATPPTPGEPTHFDPLAE